MKDKQIKDCYVCGRKLKDLHFKKTICLNCWYMLYSCGRGEALNEKKI